MRLALHWQVLIGLAIGVLYAWLSIQFGWNEFTIDYIKPFGDIFINVLKLIAVPLVLFSIISGVASLVTRPNWAASGSKRSSPTC